MYFWIKNLKVELSDQNAEFYNSLCFLTLKLCNLTDVQLCLNMTLTCLGPFQTAVSIEFLLDHQFLLAKMHALCTFVLIQSLYQNVT